MSRSDDPDSLHMLDEVLLHEVAGRLEPLGNSCPTFRFSVDEGVCASCPQEIQQAAQSD